jgi:putative tryptophan/tyrosine transport system substrate-binding protein
MQTNNKRKIVFLLMAFLLTFIPAGAPQSKNKTVLIIKQSDFEPIPTIIKNVRNGLAKTDPAAKVQEATVDNAKMAIAKINEINPAVILLVGTDIGKSLAENSKNIPIVISDMFKPKYASEFPNDRCVVNSLYMPVGIRIEYAQKILSDLKVIGIIYNPAKNSDVVEDAEKCGNARGLTIERFPVSTEKDIQAIEKMKIDALLLIPDSLVCSPISLKHIAELCLQERVPMIGISEYFAQTGTVAAISPDFEAYAKQVIATISSLLRGTPITAMQGTFPDRADYFINAAIAKAENVKIKDEVTRGAKKIFGR